jgi:tRNA-Thr(GGU) m(6)t(6)A37 methyltransferase TsaA
MEMKIIARIHSEFPEKFGIPRQPGLVESLEATIRFEPEYRNPLALVGLEGYSHLWLIWEFSEAVRDTWSPMVHPPRLGGKKKRGVFATRSPFRPNPIGLSSVKLVAIEKDPEYGMVLRVTGADLMDGTPIYDIKPYLPFADSHPEASGGFADEFVTYHLEVVFPEALLCQVPENKRKALLGILSQDPRPSYQNNPERVYGVAFGRQNIRFRVADGVLTVCAVEEYQPEQYEKKSSEK